MSDPVTFTVGVQRHESRFNEAGVAETGVAIPVTLSTGESFVVWVPDATYRDTVATKALIADEAAHHAEIGRFGGTV